MHGPQSIRRNLPFISKIFLRTIFVNRLLHNTLRIAWKSKLIARSNQPEVKRTLWALKSGNPTTCGLCRCYPRKIVYEGSHSVQAAKNQQVPRQPLGDKGSLLISPIAIISIFVRLLTGFGIQCSINSVFPSFRQRFFIQFFDGLTYRLTFTKCLDFNS